MITDSLADFLGCTRWGLTSLRLSLLHNFLSLIRSCENFFTAILILRSPHISRHSSNSVSDMIGNLMWFRTLNTDNFLFCGSCSSHLSAAWRTSFSEDTHNCSLCRSSTTRFSVNSRYSSSCDVDTKCLWINVSALLFSSEQECMSANW